MPIKIYLLQLIIVLSIGFPGKHAQQTGKKYKALLSEACKLMTDGGCMIYTYRVLNFNQDSVTLSYEVDAKCSPPEREKNYINNYQNSVKIYKWNSRNNQIFIEGFDEYEELIIQDSTITGFDKFSGRAIMFREVKN